MSSKSNQIDCKSRKDGIQQRDVSTGLLWHSMRGRDSGHHLSEQEEFELLNS
jgi:hypothetical protein